MDARLPKSIQPVLLKEALRSQPPCRRSPRRAQCRELVGDAVGGFREAIQGRRSSAAAARARGGTGRDDDSASGEYALQVRRVDLMAECRAIDVAQRRQGEFSWCQSESDVRIR